jgi:3-dehydroquinate dehydratase/shikimate dehydrogenase
MICVAIKGPTFAEAHAQIMQAIPHADLIELRLDYFDEVDLVALGQLKQKFSIPMIFALKGIIQGGQYKGIESERLKLICRLAELKPEYMDLESHLDIQFLQQLNQNHPSIKFIISFHDFSKTPDDLTAVFDRMQKPIDCIYKIAVRANSGLDVLKFIDWEKKIGTPIIGISMGTFGQISRILQPIVGGYFTYACLDEDLKTAPGQITAGNLLDCYHFRRLNSHSKIFGLIGDPIEQSLSHQSHNYSMRESQINAVYVKMQVKPSQLQDFLQYAKKLPFSGLSVTMPLKESVIPFLDFVDPEVQRIGACNTLVFEDEKIYGFNTDGFGALNAIEKYVLVKEKRIVIIGAGGAAKAIIYEACRRGAHVTVVNRDAKKAELVAAHFGCNGKALDRMEECYRDGYDIIINCTPIEMPIDEQYILPGTLVMDIRTRPKESLFLKHAFNKGCKVVFGYEMFIEQAIGQFNLWFKERINSLAWREKIECKIMEFLQ